MSGIAIAIPGADFSGKNLGKVTFLEDVDVTGIAIVANDSYEGQTAQLSIAYTPATTNQKGVIWSISSGSTYASIDASSGKLTILEGANNSTVTVKATSIYNSSVFAEKAINVTYAETVEELTSIAIEGPSTVSMKATYSVLYSPENTAYKGVEWVIDSGSDYATINVDTGELIALDGANSAQVTIKAVSIHDRTIVATKTITVSYTVEWYIDNRAAEPTKAIWDDGDNFSWIDVNYPQLYGKTINLVNILFFNTCNPGEVMIYKNKNVVATINITAEDIANGSKTYSVDEIVVGESDYISCKSATSSFAVASKNDSSYRMYKFRLNDSSVGSMYSGDKLGISLGNG